MTTDVLAAMNRVTLDIVGLVGAYLSIAPPFPRAVIATRWRP